MVVDLLPLVRIRVQVVVVERERGEAQPVALERLLRPLDLGLVVAVAGDVAGDERPVPKARPRGELERVEAVRAGPRGHIVERAIRHAGAQEPELHCATSTQLRVRRGLKHRCGDRHGPDAIIADRQAVGSALAADRLVRVGDERVEAVGVALRVTARKGHVGRGLGRERREVARNGLAAGAAPHPQRLGRLLVEEQGLGRPGDLEPEMVLAPGGDLGDDDGSDDAALKLEHQRGDVLGLDVADRRGGPVAGAVERVPAGGGALGMRDRGARREANDALAGDELDEIAPVGADVGEGPGGAAQSGVDPPVVVVRREQPVLQVPAVHERDGAGGPVGDPGARLPHRRVVPIDERHRQHAAAVACGRRELAGTLLVESDRLLADDVLAGTQGGERVGDVQVVGSADVDDVDRIGGDQVLGRREAGFRAQLCGRLRRALGAGGGDTGDPATCQQRGSRVDPADEAGSDDAGAQLLGPSRKRDSEAPAARPPPWMRT